MSTAGLQPERTSLAWTRTSLAVLLNGALLFAKDVDAYGGWRWTAGVLTSATIAVLLLWIGRRRQRALRGPTTQAGAARTEIVTAGIGVVLLVATVTLALFD
jgi:membrane protein implicated in regulation of membrane protease activity